MYRSLDDPPRVPVFTGGREKRPNQVQMLTTAVSEMARAMSNSPVPLNSPAGIPQTQMIAEATRAPTGISPGKVANLRTNYLQQMRDLHALYENGALSEIEFKEQKMPILQQLKKLSQC